MSGRVSAGRGRPIVFQIKFLSFRNTVIILVLWSVQLKKGVKIVIIDTFRQYFFFLTLIRLFKEAANGTYMSRYSDTF